MRRKQGAGSRGQGETRGRILDFRFCGKSVACFPQGAEVSSVQNFPRRILD
ncbi:MAG: hypothetical protein ACRAVC_04640 [Trichormus sp.]